MRGLSRLCVQRSARPESPAAGPGAAESSRKQPQDTQPPEWVPCPRSAGWLGAMLRAWPTGTPAAPTPQLTRHPTQDTHHPHPNMGDLKMGHPLLKRGGTHHPHPNMGHPNMSTHHPHPKMGHPSPKHSAPST